MGSSMPWRYGLMCSQLHKHRHWRHTVASFQKAVKEKPFESAFCAAWQLDTSCKRAEGGGRFHGLLCWKCVSKWESNNRSGRQVSRNTVSAILLSSPGMRPMEAWMCWRRNSMTTLLRMGLNAKAKLTLPLLAHICAIMLLTQVRICAHSAILGKKGRCIKSAPRSRSLIVTFPWGLQKDTKCAQVAVEKGEC